MSLLLLLCLFYPKAKNRSLYFLFSRYYIYTQYIIQKIQIAYSGKLISISFLFPSHLLQRLGDKQCSSFWNILCMINIFFHTNGSGLYLCFAYFSHYNGHRRIFYISIYRYLSFFIIAAYSPMFECNSILFS